MVKLNESHPLSSFLRDHQAHIERLRATGEPEVLTVDGKAEVVIQDAAAYRAMIQALDAVESAEIVRRRLADVKAGKQGTPADIVLAEVRQRLGLEEKRV